MSTLAYASLTTRREKAPPGTSTTNTPPGVKSYVDALAALVPSEVLAVHAVIVSLSTKTEGTTPRATIITDAEALQWAFFGLIVTSVVLFIGPRARTWERFDVPRAAIPPLAFVGWTMLQKTTAFDAVCPTMSDGLRTAVALILAVLLGAAASVLAKQADARQSPA